MKSGYSTSGASCLIGIVVKLLLPYNGVLMIRFVVLLALVKTMINTVSHFTEAAKEKDTFFFQTPLSFAEVHSLDVI